MADKATVQVQGCKPSTPVNRTDARAAVDALRAEGYNATVQGR